MNDRIIIAALLFASVILNGCMNPCAPAFDDSDPGQDILGDQTTIEGVFQNFQMAYILQDTSIYGELLAPDFSFEFTNWDAGITESWGRDIDMRITHRMFNQAQNIDLVWLRISQVSGDSLRSTVRRSFELTVTLSPENILGVRGYANLMLERSNPEQVWKITRWVDESDF
jgi:hypothetical protein